MPSDPVRDAVPGLAGIVGDPRTAKPDLDRMMSCLVRDPRDGSGTYGNDEIGIHVGWATRDASTAAALPVWNAGRDVCLVFIGEDFTDTQERRRLAGDRAGSPGAGYLLDLYEALGPHFVDQLNGCFRGVVVDLRERFALLFNDRYGLARMYCHEKPGCVYFASEAKALLRVLPSLRTIDARSAAETLSMGCVLEDRTLFSGVSLLPPASRWTFARGAVSRKERYFEARSWEAQEPLAQQDFEAELTATFARVLPRYTGGAQAVAASLTGGLDSRMIMAWARGAPGALPCYSFAGTYRDSLDVKLARRIARVCRQPHETISVGNEFLDSFAELAPKTAYLSDGAMDVTGAVELYINRLAARVAPVRLTGNYGSEILRGNVAFRPGRWQEATLHPHVVGGLRQAEQTYARERSARDLSFVAFKQVPWHHYARLSIEQSQLVVRSPFLDNDLVGLIYRAPNGRAMDNAAILRLVARGNPELAAMPSDRGEVLHPMPGIGRMRRAFRSLEIRAEYAFDYGMPPWLARANRTLAPLRVERAFLGRHKFYHFRVWYRDRLHGYVRDVLLDPRTRQRSFFRPDALERMVREHGNGAGNWTREITRALTFELTQRTLIDQ